MCKTRQAMPYLRKLLGGSEEIIYQHKASKRDWALNI